MDDKTKLNRTPTIVFKIPGITLTGTPAVIALIAILPLVGLVVVRVGPPLRFSPLWLSGALWILFIGYWSYAARNAAPASSSESRSSRSLHESLMNVALLLLFVPVPGLTRRFLPIAPWLVLVGLALHAGSALLAVWARRHLGRNWSGAIATRVGHELVRSGPYRRVRHLVYTAMLGMFLGTALVSGQLHALLAMILISIAYWRKIRLEERQLIDLFGAAYDDYRRDTRALIPGVL